MTKTKVVHYKHDEYDIYIGRGSVFGNPFQIGVDGSREDVIEKYKKWLWAGHNGKLIKLQVAGKWYNNVLVIERIHQLKGKRIACFCSPQSCHGDILVKYIEWIYKDERP